jgi:hypothetical protein
MDVLTFIFESEQPTEVAEEIRHQLKQRDDEIEFLDVDGADARREAMLLIGETARIGPKPDAIFDSDGNPDFSQGVVIVESNTGRRNLYIGDEALDEL